MGSNLAICGLSEGNSGGSVEVLVWKRRKGRPIKIFLEPSHFALPRSEVKEDKFLLPNEKKHASFFQEYKHFFCNKSCCCSATNLCLTLCNPMTSLSFTVSWSLLKLMSIESVMPSNHLILCRPFSFCPQFSPALGSFPMSQLFASWPKYWSFTSASVQSFQWIFRVDILRTDWFDLLGVLKVS